MLHDNPPFPWIIETWIPIVDSMHAGVVGLVASRPCAETCQRTARCCQELHAGGNLGLIDGFANAIAALPTPPGCGSSWSRRRRGARPRRSSRRSCASRSSWSARRDGRSAVDAGRIRGGRFTLYGHTYNGDFHSVYCNIRAMFTLYIVI